LPNTPIRWMFSQLLSQGTPGWLLPHHRWSDCHHFSVGCPNRLPTGHLVADFIQRAERWAPLGLPSSATENPLCFPWHRPCRTCPSPSSPSLPSLSPSLFLPLTSCATTATTLNAFVFLQQLSRHMPWLSLHVDCSPPRPSPGWLLMWLSGKPARLSGGLTGGLGSEQLGVLRSQIPEERAWGSIRAIVGTMVFVSLSTLNSCLIWILPAV
jgi:hypothetical protein